MMHNSNSDFENFLTNLDVIIIGAGPVGAYTAGKLGEAGLKVAVFERQKRGTIRSELGYIHFDVHMYEKLGIPRPLEGSDIMAGTFHEMWQIPLNENRKFPVYFDTDILRMPEFSDWIVAQAEKCSNVRIYFESRYLSPVTEGSRITGVNIENHGAVYGKIIIDCSGRFAVVRNSLPSACGLPPLHTRPGRMFTVYMEEWECPSGFPKGSNTYVCYKGFANQVSPGSTLVGASTLMGTEAAKTLHQEFTAYHLKDLPHNVKNILCSEVPYDFSPSSMVADGFVSIGDSAFQNKPFSGEGMASGMEAAMIAIPVIIRAIKEKTNSKEFLWDYNEKYFRTTGADFALIRGMGETLVEFTPEEFNWLYESGFISPEDMIDTWTKYSVKKGPGSIIRTFFKGIKNMPVFRRVLKGLILGMRLKSLYKKYPRSCMELPAWENKLRRLIQ